jgi:hypothetical protein
MRYSHLVLVLVTRVISVLMAARAAICRLLGESFNELDTASEIYSSSSSSLFCLGC